MIFSRRFGFFAALLIGTAVSIWILRARSGDEPNTSSRSSIAVLTPALTTQERETAVDSKNTVTGFATIEPNELNFLNQLKGSGIGTTSSTPTPQDSNVHPTWTPEVENQEQIDETEESTSQSSVTEPSGVAALKELESLSNDKPKRGSSNRIFGTRVHRPGDEAAPVNPEPTAPPSPAPTNLPALSGQARGYTMLYLMHPHARNTVEKQIDAMLRSQVKELYLGVLVDGTFGTDFEYLKSVVSRLSVDDRSLLLVLYIANGATMRAYKTTPIVAGFNQIDPVEFRDLIRFDEFIRGQYEKLVSRTKEVLALNLRLDPRNRNIVIPMLEDNLDTESYRAIRGMTHSILGDTAEIVRNACPGCYRGTNPDPLGDAIETHDPVEVASLSPKDGFTLDGVGYSFSEEAPSDQPTLDQIRSIESQARDRGIRYFGLWRKQRQGLGSTSVHPDDRRYEVPTDLQIKEEIDLLRAGLPSSQ